MSLKYLDIIVNPKIQCNWINL